MAQRKANEQCDVSAATGPCIQKSTFNQSELVKRTRKFAEWPLDMYHSLGHVSPCIVCSFKTANRSINVSFSLLMTYITDPYDSTR